MGKSTLARRIGAAVGGSWLLLDLRGLKAQAIAGHLKHAATRIRRDRDLAGIVVDDLNFDDQPSTYENVLIRLLQSCQANHCNVVITTHQSLPSRVGAELSLPAFATINVPQLQEAEVREVLSLHGCPPGQALENWAKVVHAKTLGHPLLAHARTRRLQAEGWPSSREALMASLQESADLGEVQREARQRLAADLPSPAARALAHRLSVFISRFSRKLALAIAKAPEAPDAFDRLCGPWIEGPTSGYFNLSPLLRGDPEEVMGESAVAAVRRDICEAILKMPSLGTVEFSELVFQGFRVSDEQALRRAVMISWKIPDEHAPTVLSHTSWLTVLKTTPGERLFASDFPTSLLLRDLQFRTAVATDLGAAQRIVRAWEAELDGLAAVMNEKQVAFPKSQFLLRVLWTLEFPLEPQDAVRFASELLELHKKHTELVPPSMPPPGLAQPEATIEEGIVDSLLLRLRGPKVVTDFLLALETASPTVSEPILRILRTDANHAVSLMMSLFETPPPTLPSEAGLVEATDTAIRLGRARDVPHLVAAAYRTLAIVEHEYRRDSSAALARLDAAVAALANEPRAIAEYRATIFTAIGRHAEALAIWRSILPAWKGAEWARVFAAKEAGIAASRLGDHAAAEGFFGQAEELARQLGMRPLAVGLIGERALSLWRGGFKPEAVIVLADALAALTALPDPATDLQARTLHKLIGYSILWMLKDTPGSEFADLVSVPEPAAGVLSKDKPDEAFRALPLGPIEDGWGLLIALTIELDADKPTDELLKRAPASGSLRGRFARTVASVKQAIRRPIEMRAVRRAVEGYDVFVDAQRERDSAQSAAAPAADVAPKGPQLDAKGDFVADILAACLLTLSRDPDGRVTALEQWRADLGLFGLEHSAVARWVKTMASIIIDGHDPMAVANDANADRASRLAAAALVLSGEHTPNHLFVAAASLVQGYELHLWRRAVEARLETLVVEAWRKLVQEQVFALRSPRIAVPAIEAACADATAGGFSKCARILLAGHLATSVRMSAEAMAALSTIAGGSAASQKQSST